MDNSLPFSDPKFSEEIIEYSLEDVFVNKKDIYNCSICLEMKPVLYQCYNGHLNCLQCWENHLKTRKTCPVCRLNISLQTLGKNLALELFLSQEIMKCPYSDLCEYMNYGTFKDKHIRECEYRSIKCECLAIMKFNELEKHQKQCPKSKLSCSHCQTVFFRDLNHLEICDEMNISCHQCQTKIKRKELIDHVRDACPKTKIICPFKYLGCGDDFYRQDKRSHFTSDQHINVCMGIGSDQPVFMTTLEKGTFETTFEFLGVDSALSYQKSDTEDKDLVAIIHNLGNQPFAKDYDYIINLYDKNNKIISSGVKSCLLKYNGQIFGLQDFQSIKLTIFKKNQLPQYT
ncbi:hypothetical protein CYY_006682 [Polysphondylium violaceum]|uniref:TRAF-type domain-containing protein n=1 Tax=Polysphondylium violaceum TaxID=133409 RepID=A0A8J4PQZ4_9MYCE|nr:hypothetical protein CYY_006682 [Polysphondylium violaceum]